MDLVVVGAADAQRLAGSRWHVVARAWREGRSCLSPAEHALLLLRLAERHLRSLRSTLHPAL